MRYIPTAFKIIINMFFFSVYSLIWIIAENFIYGLIMTQWLWKIVPNAQDSVHLKLAIITIVLVLVLTFFFRKYFYISIFWKNNDITTELPKNYIKKTTKKEPKKAERVILNEDEIEIFIDKEIK